MSVVVLLGLIHAQPLACFVILGAPGGGTLGPSALLGPLFASLFRGLDRRRHVRNVVPVTSEDHDAARGIPVGGHAARLGIAEILGSAAEIDYANAVFVARRVIVFFHIVDQFEVSAPIPASARSRRREGLEAKAVEVVFRISRAKSASLSTQKPVCAFFVAPVVLDLDIIAGLEVGAPNDGLRGLVHVALAVKVWIAPMANG